MHVLCTSKHEVMANSLKSWSKTDSTNRRIGTMWPLRAVLWVGKMCIDWNSKKSCCNGASTISCSTPYPTNLWGNLPQCGDSLKLCSVCQMMDPRLRKTEGKLVGRGWKEHIHTRPYCTNTWCQAMYTQNITKYQWLCNVALLCFYSQNDSTWGNLELGTLSIPGKILLRSNPPLCDSLRWWMYL